jgi:enoyl-CoA hydratase/carnithine racemase
MLGEGRDQASEYLRGVLAVIGRVLVFPAITVAATNGHAFGAGAQLVVAHDYRLMRSGRGFFCMPEIDMKVPLHPGMTAVLQARLPKRTVHEVIATGRRYAAGTPSRRRSSRRRSLRRACSRARSRSPRGSPPRRTP